MIPAFWLAANKHKQIKTVQEVLFIKFVKDSILILFQASDLSHSVLRDCHAGCHVSRTINPAFCPRIIRFQSDQIKPHKSQVRNSIAPRDKSHKQRAKNLSLLNIYAQRKRTTKKLFHLKMLKFLTINWYLPCLYLEVSSLKIAAGCCWTLLLLLKSQTCNSIFNADRRVQKSI